MTMSRSGLPIYLYGYDYDWHKDESGKLHVAPRLVEKHCWGNKEKTSGFFNSPGAREHQRCRVQQQRHDLKIFENRKCSPDSRPPG